MVESLLVRTSTGFVWWGFHKVKCAYLEKREKLKMTIWYEVHTSVLKSISGTNVDFLFVVWPVSVGLERCVIF